MTPTVTHFFSITTQDSGIPRDPSKIAAFIREALDWRGPGTKPHKYWPDYQAMGDCAVCGHMRHDHPEERT